MESTVILALWGAASVFVLWVAFAKTMIRRFERRRRGPEPPELSPEERLELESASIASAMDTVRRHG